MATKIVTKNSSTASAVPTASDLVQGELAVNVADKRLFTEDNGGAIVELGTNPSTIDINAGSIDGTAIGASSASTGAFTTLTASGAVGIGTSSPSAKLHLKDTTGSAVNLLRLETGWDNPSGNKSIEWTDATNALGRISVDYTAPKAKMRFGSLYNSGYQTGDVMTLTADGNVGIGNSSPAGYGKFVVQGTGNLINANASSGAAAFQLYEGGQGRFAIETLNGSAGAKFLLAGTERMRIDSSGNLLVGTTDRLVADGTGTGLVLGGQSDLLHVSRNAGDCAKFNRVTNDGSIVTFAKDGTAVGSIGASGGDLMIGTGDTGLYFYDAADAIIPWNIGTNSSRDNAIDLGASNYRFKNIYRSGSTYSTSDRNMKQDIRELTDAERNVAVACKGLLKAFRFIDAVEKDGGDANIHFGVIAQELAEAFEAEGLDANDYQVYKSATTTDEDGNEQTRLNVCYENLLAFIISAI